MDAEQRRQQQVTAEGLQFLKEAISLICSSWRALQLAVEHEAGGPHSSLKAVKLENDIFSWFTHAGEGPLDEFNLEDKLDEFLLGSLCTVVEDGSIEDVNTVFFIYLILLLTNGTILMNDPNHVTTSFDVFVQRPSLCSVSAVTVAAELMAVHKEFLVDNFSAIEKPRQEAASQVKSNVRMVSSLSAAILFV